MIQEHRYDVVIVGAGGAGMPPPVEAGPGYEPRSPNCTNPQPHRRGAGRHVRGTGQRRRRQLGVARSTPSRAATTADQDAVEVMCKEAIDAVLDLEKMGMPFNRTRRDGSTSAGSATPATTARPPCAGPATPRTARAHDPADALSKLRQTRCGVLQRVLRPGPGAHPDARRSGCHRRHRIPGDRRHPHLPRQSHRLRDGWLRPDVQDHLERASDRRRAGESSSGGLPWRDVEFHNSTRQVWPDSGFSSPEAVRGGQPSDSTATVNASWRPRARRQSSTLRATRHRRALDGSRSPRRTRRRPQ